MNRSPILKALSSIRKSGARTLLLGGQACVFYGAAEFSRDLDLLILSDADGGRVLRTLSRHSRWLPSGYFPEYIRRNRNRTQHPDRQHCNGSLFHSGMKLQTYRHSEQERAFRVRNCTRGAAAAYF